jgi:hypothetical protein
MFRQVIAIISEVVVSSEATHAICIVDVYGLRPVQSGEWSRDVNKRVNYKDARSNCQDCREVVMVLEIEVNFTVVQEKMCCKVPNKTL